MAPPAMRAFPALYSLLGLHHRNSCNDKTRMKIVGDSTTADALCAVDTLIHVLPVGTLRKLREYHDEP